MNTPNNKKQYAKCLKNKNYEYCLNKGTIYEVLKPEENDGEGTIRVIDESGEDYLYPAHYFSVVRNKKK